MSTKRLILVRGLPGSGKSTYAKALKGTHVHLETDMYFIDREGNYTFDGERIGAAHRWCIDTTRILLNSGANVVVSNTFVKLWELEPYLEMVNNDDVAVIEMKKAFKNVHNVPQEVIDRMKRQWQPFSRDNK